MTRAPTAVVQSYETLLMAPYAPNQSVDQRLTQISADVHRLSKLAPSLLASTRDDEFSWGVRAMLATSMAPSVARLVEGVPHDSDVAKQVYDNVQEATVAILGLAHTRRHDEIVGRHTRGSCAELAILGTFWYGTSAGALARDSYAIPTSDKDDNGRGSHRHLAHDLRLKTWDGVWKAQVKASRSQDTQSRAQGHAQADVAVITPDDLLPDSQQPIKDLLTLVADRSPELHDLAGDAYRIATNLDQSQIWFAGLRSKPMSRQKRVRPPRSGLRPPEEIRELRGLTRRRTAN